MEYQDTDTTCAICYAEFLDPEDLAVHTLQVHVNESNISRFCMFCSKIFPSMETFVIHLRDTHLHSMKCCQYCTKAFTDFTLLRQHQIKHNANVKKSLYKCSQCTSVFYNIFDLERHEYKDHNNADDGIMLNDCFSVLSSVLNIKASTFLQSLGSNIIYICMKCEYTTPEVGGYIRHLQEQDCRSLVCDKCSNIYKEKRGLAKHMNAQRACCNYVAKRDLFKECSKCLKKIEALHLSDHMKYCVPVKCTVCSIPFASVEQLADHQSREHPLAITLTSCKFCRREFVGSVALEKHVNRTHKSEFHLYKYACVYCESTYFKHPKDLFTHFFTKHPELQPYSCRICNKTFRIRKRFTFHIKLDHKSVGFIEFDDKYHVFFAERKSENPFQPTSHIPIEDVGNDTEIVNESGEETVVEASESERKPLKIRLKEQKKAIKIVNLNSDFMSATETEACLTETESKTAAKRKSKLQNPKPSKFAKKSTKKRDAQIVIQSSDDEPLVNVKKREKLKRKLRIQTLNTKKRTVNKVNKNLFTCNICKKYCYTYQNYHHHVSLHFKNEVKKCVKCSQEFHSKKELNKHMEKEHKTSRLTETLKNLLERRKQGGTYAQPQLSTAEKFLRTIKRVKSEVVNGNATISEVPTKLSVQKFIENFTPDTTEAVKESPAENEGVVSIKTLKYAMKRPPVIKMTKFRQRPENVSIKLAMPVRFKTTNTDEHTVSIKVVQSASNYESDKNNYEENDYQDEPLDYEEQIDNDSDDKGVPDVAEEVMLEDTVGPKPLMHKIVIPKLSTEYKDIRIAHLLPQAPYYKIVKVDDVLKKTEKEEDKQEDVQLPSGTKLVNVNPLAHLLGDTPVEKVIGERKKNYYKPKTDNFEKAIAKALLQLENPSAYPKKYKKKKPLEVEQ